MEDEELLGQVNSSFDFPAARLSLFTTMTALGNRGPWPPSFEGSQERMTMSFGRDREPHLERTGPGLFVSSESFVYPGPDSPIRHSVLPASQATSGNSAIGDQHSV